MTLFIWPQKLPPAFEHLAHHLSPDLGSSQDGDLAALTTSGEHGHTVVMFVAGNELGASGVDWLQNLDRDCGMKVVVVVDDSYLGTDRNRPLAAISGAAISIVRSLAVERGTTIRANAICVPEGLVRESGEMRGPLPVNPDVTDVAEAINLFAGPDGEYLSGQVLFLNGGRQLFSSLTS